MRRSLSALWARLRPSPSAPSALPEEPTGKVRLTLPVLETEEIAKLEGAEEIAGGAEALSLPPATESAEWEVLSPPAKAHGPFVGKPAPPFSGEKDPLSYRMSASPEDDPRSVRPFRTEPHEVLLPLSMRQVEFHQARNSLSAHEQWVFEETEAQVLARLRTTPSPYDTSSGTHITEAVARALWLRAEGSAREEGLVWTPLHDELACRAHWPQEQTTWHFTRTTVPYSVARTHQVLREWMLRQQDAAELERLARFQWTPLLGLLAQETPLWSEALTKRLLDDPDTIPLLLENPHFPESLAQVAARTAVENLVTRDVSKLSAKEQPRGEYGHLLERFQSLGWYRLQEEEIHLLLDTVEGGVPGVGKEGAQAFQYWSNGSPQRAAAKALLSLPGALDSERLARLLESVRRSPDFVAQVIEHPAFTADLAINLAQKPLHGDVQRALCRSGDWLSVPEVRAGLRTNGVFGALKAVLHASPPEEYRETVHSLLRLRSPSKTLDLLERQSPERLRLLLPTDLAPLLALPGPEARLRALRLLGRVQSVATEVPAMREAPPSSPPRR